MKRLTLLRHAKSSHHRGPPLSDRKRPLSDRGERDAPLMGTRLKARKARPSLIVTSPAIRALKTARLVAEALGYPQEFLHIEESLYLAEWDKILETIAMQDDAFSDVLLVGHNPGLTDLANRLLPDLNLSNLPTAGALAIDFATERWSEIGRSEARLAYYDYPKNPELLLIED
jgi:phosphohistidine phosphatase